jgi:hypothetical protein
VKAARAATTTTTISLGLGLGLGLALAGCAEFPGAGDAGRRVLVDGFVVLTSPVQVPAMAARDAWDDCGSDHPALLLLLPVFFVGRTVEHAVLAAMHGVDLVAAPIHACVGNGPPRIYEPYQLPMPWCTDSDLGHETGELALYDAAGVGGAVIAWWFATIYIPHLFHWIAG